MTKREEELKQSTILAGLTYKKPLFRYIDKVKSNILNMYDKIIHHVGFWIIYMLVCCEIVQQDMSNAWCFRTKKRDSK